MGTRIFSIRTLLLLTVSLLTVVIALLVLREVYLEWNKLRKIQDLKNAVLLSDQLFDTTEKLSVERDIALSLLLAVDAKTAGDLKARMAESRQEAKDSLDTTLIILQKFRIPELAELRSKIDTHRQTIGEVRQQIDKAVTMSVEQRDKALPDRWTQEVNLLLDQTQYLWTEFVRHFTDINPAVTQHLRFKHLMRIITDNAGQERSLIGRLIVENVDPTPEESVELLRGQGIILNAWQMSELLGSQSQLFPDIAPEYTDARSHYLTMRDMFQKVFYIPGARHGEAYPISADLWFELSLQANESMNALKAATLKKTRDFILQLETQANNNIFMHLALLVLTCVLCGYSFWIITRRVIHPINTMIGALLDAIRGKPVPLALPDNRQDEIGKLGEVLHAFQEKVEEIRRTARELERSENTLRLIFDHALDGIITMNQNGDITAWNEQAGVIFGWTYAEAVGKSLADLIIPPVFRDAHRQGLAHFLKDGTTHILNKRIELEALHRGGKTFPIELTVTAQKQEESYYFTAFIRDITERKKAESNLLRYTQALEHSNKELDDFAYIASHDLKEPLRGIHNHARFLLEDNQDKLDQDSVARLNRLSYLSQRMETLVNELLYFSRLGRQEMAVQPTDMNDIIHDIENTLELFLHEHNARITVPAKLPTAICDKPRVTEAFRNLITNAVKYNDKPEKIVEIGCIDAFLFPQGMGCRYAFYVKDNGKGIPQEFHEEVFRIFKRLQASKDSKEEGTGAGLTFVKKIVERHGGKIWLESTVGEGTTFYFTLGGAT